MERGWIYEEKKTIKINLSTFFLILAIIVICIMGYFIYKLNNDITKATNQVSQLNNKITLLESDESKHTEENVISKNTEANTTAIKETEKQLNVNDIIALGYNNIVFLVNGKPYYIPVFDRDNNYDNYKINEVKNVSGKVSKIRMFSLGTDPSESTFLVYEDGHIESLSNMEKGLEAHQGVLDSTKNIVDIVEENGIVYAVSQNGDKTKIDERYPDV